MKYITQKAAELRAQFLIYGAAIALIALDKAVGIKKFFTANNEPAEETF